jgi:hypothetical protein
MKNRFCEVGVQSEHAEMAEGHQKEKMSPIKQINMKVDAEWRW